MPPQNRYAIGVVVEKLDRRQLQLRTPWRLLFCGRKHTANIPVEQSFCYNEWSLYTQTRVYRVYQTVCDIQMTSARSFHSSVLSAVASYRRTTQSSQPCFFLSDGTQEWRATRAPPSDWRTPNMRQARLRPVASVPRSTSRRTSPCRHSAATQMCRQPSQPAAANEIRLLPAVN